MIKEIQAKSILRKQKKIESWFMTHYGMNLYRGCAHSCAYCDGRAEKYQAPGDFSNDIEVKVNAIDLLNREMDPARKRKPMPRSYMIIGGGVCDAYQPVEEKYQLSRKTLELMEKYNFPVHILTKSVLVERDMDILERILKNNPVIISFSFSSVDEKISKIFEPGVPSPERRLDTIRKFKAMGAYCGMFMMPVIPFITDTYEMMDNTLATAKQAGIDFAIFGGMTLKYGRQADHFMNVLSKHFSDLTDDYRELFRHSGEYGQAPDEYYGKISQIFDELASRHKINKRIPAYIFQNVLNTTDRIHVFLEHLDYLLKLKGNKSTFGYASYSLSKYGKPVEEINFQIERIRGVNQKAINVIEEVLKTGTCKQYEELLIN